MSSVVDYAFQTEASVTVHVTLTNPSLALSEVSLSFFLFMILSTSAVPQSIIFQRLTVTQCSTQHDCTVVVSDVQHKPN